MAPTRPTSPEQMLPLLQKELGEDAVQKIEFKNWAGLSPPRSVYSVRPKNLAEIQKVIRFAKEQNMRVRCVGAAHSWSPVFSDDNQILMETKWIKDERGNIRLNEPVIVYLIYLKKTPFHESARFIFRSVTFWINRFIDIRMTQLR